MYPFSLILVLIKVESNDATFWYQQQQKRRELSLCFQSFKAEKDRIEFRLKSWLMTTNINRHQLSFKSICISLPLFSLSLALRKRYYYTATQKRDMQRMERKEKDWECPSFSSACTSIVWIAMAHYAPPPPSSSSSGTTETLRIHRKKKRER